jgi:L-serine dehydratase
MARDLLGEEPASARFCFDPGGSLAEVYRRQGSDRAFAAGLLGFEMTDEAFLDALAAAEERGVEILFAVEPLEVADHPNAVEMDVRGRRGAELSAAAKSVGGGAVEITRINGWPVRLQGDAHEILVLADREELSDARSLLESEGALLEPPVVQKRGERALLHGRRAEPLGGTGRSSLGELLGVREVRAVAPVVFVRRGAPPFTSGAEMVAVADDEGISLGEAALRYEASLLGMPKQRVSEEIWKRYGVMEASVERGLEAELPSMQLLRPSAGSVYRAEAEGKLAAGGLHARAAARAMAVMHVNGGMGVICAAPTAGSAGVIPGTVVTMVEEWDLGRRDTVMALLAAAAVGVVIGARATFAAEVAGCQVEIGAAGAMAAAAVVEAAGGGAGQAADAAAIALQNSMGSICDMVQGVVEIPCHTRNAAAASGAFVCADLILGGYENPIPLDETVDAVYATGRMLPRALKCTALGGLADTPSARRLPRLC